MGFVAIFAAAWIAIFVIYAMNKSLTIRENAYVYLTQMILGINFTWIVAEELHYIEISRDALSYISFMLYRTLLVPLIYVILMNAVFKARRLPQLLIAVGSAFGVGLGLKGLLLYFDILRYEKWNLIYDGIQILLMQVVIYTLLRLYRKVVYAR